MSKIGVLGSGDVGKVLARGCAAQGHEVMIGSRTPESLSSWQSEDGSLIQLGTMEETAAFGDIVILAVKGLIVQDVVDGLKSVLSGKTVIDATNPINDSAPQDGVISLFTSLEESLMERLQSTAPEANFVKAFNSVGNAFMVKPNFKEGKPTMFICGNSDSAKSEVKTLGSISLTLTVMASPKNPSSTKGLVGLFGKL